MAVVAAGTPGPILLGHQVQGDAQGELDLRIIFHCKEFLLGDVVFVRVQSPWAGENRDGATCVDMMDDAVEGFGCGGAGPQQRRRRESGDSGSGLRAPWGYKRRSTCLGEGALSRM